MSRILAIALILIFFEGARCQFSNALPGGRRASDDFDCAEEFGYYPHPSDCSRYYVCVFGGALEETCSAGLVYSTELQTCDWPRNVASCNPRSGEAHQSARAARLLDVGFNDRGRSGRLLDLGFNSRDNSAPNLFTNPPRGRHLTTRRPQHRRVPERNSLEHPVSGTSSSVAERFRLLGDVSERGVHSDQARDFDLDTRIGGRNNKIVARRQQTLIHVDDSRDNSNHLRPHPNTFRNQLHLKPTDAPIQISTISSFSFGDTGTRFPLRSPSHAPFSPRPSSRPTQPSRPPPPPPRPHPSRGPQIHPKPSRPPRRRPEHTRFPPRHQTSTFVSSTRAPVDVRPVTHRSTFSFPTVTTPSTTTTAVTTPTPVSPAVGFTEPAYVAYFNDTIYDVYYIYDDDDIQYDELDYDGTTRFSRGPSVVTTPFSTITTTTTPSTTSARPSTSQRPLRNQIQTVFGPTKDRSPQRTPSFFSLENVRDDASDRKKTGRKRPVSRGKSSSASRQKKQSLNFAAGQTNTLGETFGTSSRPIVRPHTSISQQPVISKPTSKPQPSRERNSRNRVSLLTKNKLANLNRGSHPSNGLKSIDTGSPRQSISSSRHTKRPGSASKSSTAKLNIWAHPPRRPDPLYSQPRPDEPAERCDARCRLPDCNCGGTANPGGLKTSETPQLVVLTFDDSINDLNHDLYQEMFESKRVNPNGCPIAATFYVSHEWTNYQQVQNLYADGHEIASHSISHSFGEQFSTSKWEAEIAGQREILAAYGGVRMEDIRGMRAPFLSIGGNRMFKMLYNNNFTYDSSMPVYENNPPSWPYTLDYKIHHDCMIPPCPNKAYPGVWEVPMVMWQDLNGGRCSMVDACSAPPTAEEVYNMLIKNFQRHYTSNRAVFPLYFHAAWMTKKHHREGFMAFLDTISKMDDVWLVTNWQAIQWMRDPQSLSTIKQFQPFGCSYPERPARCVKARKCNVRHKSGVRYMTTCQACPKKYPWTGRTGV